MNYKETVDIIIRRVVLYLRLSKEDIEKPTKEAISESIKNQELMLCEEVKKHPNWRIVGVYCDEDFSGAGTYRPDFEKMIKLCENGEVDIVLCKSQSRFSRDMEIVEKYLHNKFTEWNVRFVSIVDNADTANKGNKKARQINALVNEWFLEDLSDNIKATFRTKWENGECTSSFAKYGFIKDPKNKNHLLIDPIASEIKKQIGNMILIGYGQDKIANILEEKKIPSPYEYKAMNGCKLKLPLKDQDPTCIKKAGSYVIRISLYNNYKQILKNIKSIFVLGTDELKSYNSRFHIKIRSISEDLELYYITDNFSSNIDKINLNDVDFDYGNSIWKQVKTNETIPDNVSYILSKNLELDRLIETGFEIEVTLDENRNHNIYKIFTKSISDNGIDISFEYEIRRKYKWCGRVINNMMRDPINNGILIQGKTRRISYKNHRCISASKDQWVVCEGALEKTFDDEIWLSIQSKLNEKSRAGANGEKHIFCGKVYCQECGCILRKNSSTNSKGEKIQYLLCKDKETKWANCTNNRSIRFDVMYNYVIDSINGLLSEYYDKDVLKGLYDETLENDLFKDQKDSLKKEKSDIKSLIEKKEIIFRQLYDDRAMGIIDESDFTSLRSKYKEEKEKLMERLSTIDDEIKLVELRRNKLKNKDNLLSKYKHINVLTQQLVDEFVDRIEVKKLDDTIMKDKDRIKIIWNFQT